MLAWEPQRQTFNVMATRKYPLKINVKVGMISSGVNYLKLQELKIVLKLFYCIKKIMNPWCEAFKKILNQC